MLAAKILELPLQFDLLHVETHVTLYADAYQTLLTERHNEIALAWLAHCQL